MAASADAVGQGCPGRQEPSRSRAAIPASRMRGPSAHHMGPSPSATWVGVQANKSPAAMICAGIFWLSTMQRMARAVRSAPRFSAPVLEAANHPFGNGADFGGVGGFGAVAAHDQADSAAVELNDTNKPYVAPDFALIRQRALHDFMK